MTDLKTVVLGAAAASMALALAMQPAAAADWPNRTIELACFAGAGGGTDITDRALAKAMEPVLGATINVTNRTGAGGGVAMSYVWPKPHDGYTWLGASESLHVTSVMGAHNTTAKDWLWFIAAGSPEVVSVRPDSPYKTLDDLIAGAKKAPGKIKASASNTGGLHHTKLFAFQRGAGIQLNFLPFNGSHPSQVAAMAGEVEVVMTSISEQAELIKAGKLRPLAMVEMEPYDFPGVGTIPAAGAKYPDIGKLPIKQWLGFALPADTPADIVAKVTDAFNKAMKSPQLKDLADNRFMSLYGYSGSKAQEIAIGMESAWTWALYDLGVAKKSPADFGIAKP